MIIILTFEVLYFFVLFMPLLLYIKQKIVSLTVLYFNHRHIFVILKEVTIKFRNK